jgi:hypothetical protein
MRHVHTVRLTAPQDSLIRRGAILLEDALHIASLPEPEGERVLIVRSLNIGTIRSHQSSASLALIVQQRLSEMSANAVYAIDPAASRASAVYFRNDAEPYWVLAARLAKGLPATEWFWQLAIPNWKPNLPTAEGLRLLLYQIGQTRAGVSATVAFVQNLIEQDAIAPLLTAISRQDGDRLLQLAGFSRLTPATVLLNSTHSFSESLLNSSHYLQLRHAVLNWGTDDPRSVWLGIMVLIYNHSSRLMDSRLVDRVVSLLQIIHREEQSLDSNQITQIVDRVVSLLQIIHREGQSLDSNQITQITQITQAQHDSEQLHSNTQQNHFRENPFNTTSDFTQTTNSLSNSFSTNSSSKFLPSDLSSNPSDQLLTAQPSPTWIDAPQFTPYAGLIFLIPLLDRLQIATFLENHPESIDLDLPKQIVKTMSDRLKIPSIDPTQSLFSTPHTLHPTTSTHSWITNLRRWSRRNAQMGLYNLICRPGQLLMSKTHIDVFFHHKQADIRLRRVGLDIDPGWVPWWGQVISFHYIQGE